jgi:hypothetical protein
MENTAPGSGETFAAAVFGTTIYDETGRKATTPFQATTHLTNASSPRSLILTISLLWFNFSDLLVSRKHRDGVELVRSSNECIGDFESTEKAFCYPDFQTHAWAFCTDRRSAVCQIDFGVAGLLRSSSCPNVPPSK